MSEEKRKKKKFKFGSTIPAPKEMVNEEGIWKPKQAEEPEGIQEQNGDSEEVQEQKEAVSQHSLASYSIPNHFQIVNVSRCMKLGEAPKEEDDVKLMPGDFGELTRKELAELLTLQDESFKLLKSPLLFAKRLYIIKVKWLFRRFYDNIYSYAKATFDIGKTSTYDYLYAARSHHQLADIIPMNYLPSRISVYLAMRGLTIEEAASSYLSAFWSINNREKKSGFRMPTEDAVRIHAMSTSTYIAKVKEREKKRYYDQTHAGTLMIDFQAKLSSIKSIIKSLRLKDMDTGEYLYFDELKQIKQKLEEVLATLKPFEGNNPMNIPEGI